MGAASSMVPAIVSRHAGRARGFVLGVYSTGMALGIAFLAAVSVPLERLLGGWRPALAAAGVFAAIATVVWIVYVVRRAPAPVLAGQGLQNTRLPWSDPVARMITAYYATQMTLGYACMAWIAPLYLGLGKSAGDAAALLVLFQAVQLASMLGLPAVTDLTTDRRPVLALAALSTCAGLTMLVINPVGLAIPAVALTGLGIGGGATLGLVLVVDAVDTVSDGTRLTAMSLLVGNLLGALGPVALGAVKDATGSFRPGLIALLVLSVAGLLLVQRCRPGRRLHGDRARATDLVLDP
jgi:CP family cyanate transporter-like MFS transporter